MLRTLFLALAGLTLFTVGCRTTTYRPAYYQPPTVISASPAPAPGPCCNGAVPPPAALPGAPVPIR